MAKFTQKYTIIQLFESLPEGAEFSSHDWPLHSTIVDTFATNWEVSTLNTKLEDFLRDHRSVSSVALQDEFFGHDKQVRVVLLEKTTGLLKLHDDLINLLEKGGLLLSDLQYAREGFKPHSTIQKHARLKKGDRIVFDALSLIDMFPDEDPYRRKILKTFRLRDSRS